MRRDSNDCRNEVCLERCDELDQDDRDLADLRARLTAAEGLLRGRDELLTLLRAANDSGDKLRLAQCFVEVDRALAAPPGRREAGVNGSRECPNNAGRQCIDFGDDGKERSGRCVFKCAIDNDRAAAPSGQRPVCIECKGTSSKYIGEGVTASFIPCPSCAAPIPRPAPAPEVCGTCRNRRTVFTGYGAGVQPCPACRPATPGDGR